MLAGCRGAGLLFVAPGVSSPLVPGVVRVLLGVMLGVVAFGSVETLGAESQYVAGAWSALGVRTWVFDAEHSVCWL